MIYPPPVRSLSGLRSASIEGVALTIGGISPRFGDVPETPSP